MWPLFLKKEFPALNKAGGRTLGFSKKTNFFESVCLPNLNSHPALGEGLSHAGVVLSTTCWIRFKRRMAGEFSCLPFQQANDISPIHSK